jgi:hypothetical protein
MSAFDTDPLILWLAPNHDQRLPDLHERVQSFANPSLCAGFTKSRTRISVSRGHPFQKVRDSDFSKSRTEAAADLDRFS